VSKGRSLIIKVSLRDIVFKSLSTILHARYYRWATSCIWRGFLYLSGITRIRRHEGERSTGWPRFHYIITFLVLGHALFPCLGVSSLVLFRLANRNISINRPKLDSRERECGFILIGFLLTTRASRVTQNRPSCFFVLSGCAGRARNEGRKRRSGIACKSYALSSIYPPFESDPFNVRIASLCSCLSSNVSQDLPSIILRQSCPSSNNNFLWFRGRIVRGALDKYFTEIDFSLYTFKVDLYGNRIPWQIMLQMNSRLEQSLFRNAQRKGENSRDTFSRIRIKHCDFDRSPIFFNLCFTSLAISQVLWSSRSHVPRSSHVRDTGVKLTRWLDYISPSSSRRDTLTSRSVFVPRVPTGFPVRRYSWLSIIARPPARLRHSLTRSDQPGVTTTHSAWSTPGTVLKQKEKEKKKKNQKEPSLFASSVRFRRERSSVLRLSPSFVRNLVSQISFFFPLHSIAYQKSCTDNFFNLSIDICRT